MNIKLLDCTVRDGGYINDWEFGHNNLINVFERIAESKTDIIEVGFIDDRRPFDFNRSIFPNTESIRKIYGDANTRPCEVFGMIDYGTCDIANVEPCSESFIDGIRVIFKKHRMDEAMEYCRQLKQLGYKVCSQLVSITSYDEEDFKKLIYLANDIRPHAVGIVDTYGLLHMADLVRYYNYLSNGLDKSIAIGFHAHNNLQLAYANAITFIDMAIENQERKHIVDGTLFGMGKSAGNAPLELVGKYLNDKGYDYRIRPMLEAIEESIKEIYDISPWGYKSMFYLSSENHCHPSYVSFFENKGNLSVSKLDDILSRIEPEEKKLLYDKDVAEASYKKYVEELVDDIASLNVLEKVIDSRTVLIIGPGKNIVLQKENVDRYISNNNPYIIAINYIPDSICVDCVFITKSSRYKQMVDSLHNREDKKIDIISTTNVEIKKTDSSNIICFNREPLLEKRDDIIDNSLLMLLKILAKVNVTKLALAGLDGYSDKEDNYFKASMEYGFVKSIARNLNIRIRDEINTKYSHMNIEFVTYSKYMHTEDINSGAF